MGVGAGLYIYDVVVKGSRSLSHLLMRSCYRYYKKASIRWQGSAPPISGYWPTSEQNAG